MPLAANNKTIQICYIWAEMFFLLSDKMKIKQCTLVAKNYIRVYGKELGQLLGNHEDSAT